MGPQSLSFILLLVGLFFHYSNAQASVTPNLVLNGDAENGTVGWNITQGGLSKFSYNDTGFGGIVPSPPNPGSFFFFGASTTNTSVVTQRISIPQYTVSFNVSAYFGGYLDQNDYATLTLSFLNSSGGSVGPNFTIGGINATQRNLTTGLYPYSAAGPVPQNATSFLITLTFVKVSTADNDIDGYVDSISLMASIWIPIYDCFGVLNGTAAIDACGVCGGNNQSCCLNYLGLDNNIWDWLLLRDAIDDVVGKLQDLSYILNCSSSNIPNPPSICAPQGAADNFRTTLKGLQLGDFIDTNNAWSSRCLDNFNKQVKQWTCALNPAECCVSSPF
eukprot:TRINITY_DN60_c0_g1_i1.p1 TRINITY_DN60_c0_g1~~TRINITY_DN60_c0_g1_i1.p1  ORF type:complete len:369 (-),score=101.71 TRINITY_DN60_c0_g1_i1:102-1097(-)